jgi:chromate transporter
MSELLGIFFHIFMVSLTAYSGSAQAVFYDMGVQQSHWISSRDFANYLGFGFATPGPQVFSLATFMGFGAGGFKGALAGTIAIYVAPITLSIFAGRYLRTWIEKDYMLYFIKAVGISATGLLIAIGIKIIGANALTIGYIVITGLAFIATLRKVNPIFIIVFGLMAGLFLG